MHQKSPAEEISRNNPWYTDSQHTASGSNAQSHTVERRKRFLLECIENYPSVSGPLHILDAGCGDGVNLEILSGMQSLDVTAVDYNPLRTERAQGKYPNVTVVCGSLLEPILPESSFDIVWCSQVIEHVHEDGKLLSGLYRLLRMDGMLILGTPNEGCLLARLRNHVFQRKILKTTDHVNFYREETIRHKIECAGFRITDIMRENWFFPHSVFNRILSSNGLGMGFMAALGSAIPSQTAGYYFVCRKQDH